jgi:hypothetical protein
MEVLMPRRLRVSEFLERQARAAEEIERKLGKLSKLAAKAGLLLSSALSMTSTPRRAVKKTAEKPAGRTKKVHLNARGLPMSATNLKRSLAAKRRFKKAKAEALKST